MGDYEAKSELPCLGRRAKRTPDSAYMTHDDSTSEHLSTRDMAQVGIGGSTNSFDTAPNTFVRPSNQHENRSGNHCENGTGGGGDPPRDKHFLWNEFCWMTKILHVRCRRPRRSRVGGQVQVPV